MDDEININDLLAVIVKRWYLIVFSVVVLLMIICLPQLTKKDEYASMAAMILKNDASGAQSSIGGLSSILGLSQANASNASFPTILSSRAVAAIVLDKVGLQKRIKGWDDPDVKRQALISAVQKMAIYENKDGLFEITVVTEDPALSADVANGFAAAGAEYWSKFNYTEARKKKEYIESQLPRIETNLRRAENAFKRFTMISPVVGSSAGVEMKRLEREMEIQSATYMMLRKEYETAKLDESKELEPFSMIDPAEKPLKPLKTKLLLNFVIALVLGSFGGTALAFGIEALNKPIKLS